LDEAIQELKESEFKELFKEEIEKKKYFVKDVQIDTDIEMLIPDDYVNNIQERLNLYTEMDSLESEEQLSKYKDMLSDRFGVIPPEVLELFEGLRLRWICRELGFEKLSLKNHVMRAYFIFNAQSSFY